MPLQMGDNKKLKVMINGKAYKIPLCAFSSDNSISLITNGNLMTDSQGLILKDSRGFILTAKKEDK